jgi:hypothetical protein
MDAVKYLKERSRMCKSFEDCSNCPFRRSGKTDFCSRLVGDGFEQAVAIVEKWSKEHPQKTMLQDFLEKYPNAPREGSGEPHICPSHLGYEEYDDCEYSCIECWNRPLEG